ncbi:MAG: aromatic ring-hydroxylating dioxygenase subunit alpha [Bacteroidota bacterium]
MIYNQWYVILDSKELKQKKPLKIKRFNEHLSLWRDEEGNVCCIEDKCCHRGASLSCGKIMNGKLECPFHGFIYNKHGIVETIPANGKKSKVPQTMKVRSYKAYEDYGFIWIWWGDQDKIEQEPFFFKELKDFSYSGFKDHWNVHYSRAIENQLDVVHLPFVHRTTIGRGNKTLVNGPVVIRDKELITFYVDNIVDDGKTHPLEPDEIEDYKDFFHLQFHYPNMWQNFISDKIKAFAAFVPVDEENTIVYIRYYQNLIRIPLLKQFMNYIGKISSIIILRQDKRVVITQLPKKSSLKTGEHLITGDKPIIEYRKHRQFLIDKNSSVLNDNTVNEI